MYVVGVRPTGNLAVCQGVPDVAGISGRALALIKDNKTVSGAEIRLVLAGSISEIKDTTLTLVSPENPPITIKVSEQAVVSGLPESDNNQPRSLKLEDLKVYDVIRVFGLIQGDEIVGDSIILEGRPSPVQ